jgi:hypothetical protein
MGNTLLVITDLGSFQCYSMEQREGERSPRIELVEKFNMVDLHHRYANTLTTRSGRSASGNMSKQSSGNNSDGESHNMEIEKRRRALREIAEHMNGLLGNTEFERCFLAAPEEINSQLLQALQPGARAKIERNLTCDLTRLDKSEILDHFTAAAERTV